MTKSCIFRETGDKHSKEYRTLSLYIPWLKVKVSEVRISRPDRTPGVIGPIMIFVLQEEIPWFRSQDFELFWLTRNFYGLCSGYLIFSLVRSLRLQVINCKKGRILPMYSVRTLTAVPPLSCMLNVVFILFILFLEFFFFCSTSYIRTKEIKTRVNTN